MKYLADAVLRVGTPIVIREVRADDREAVHALFARMSPESIRHRFFVAKRELTASDLAWLDGLDDERVEVALAAVSRERVVGIGRYTLIARHTAEVAFDVADEDQGRGIGTLLLEHLAKIAADHDITKLRADVEADNVAMLDVFEHSGFEVRATFDRGVYRVEFATSRVRPRRAS